MLHARRAVVCAGAGLRLRHAGTAASSAADTTAASAGAPSAVNAAAHATAVPVPPSAGREAKDMAAPEPAVVRWVQEPASTTAAATSHAAAANGTDLDELPIVDEKGDYIVSRVKWPTGDLAYTTPPPVDDKLAPRFGYNVVQVRKHVSWWAYQRKYPTLSFAYINIQLIFLLGLAWLVAFLTNEYRRTTDMMKTPGALVGEHRGRGPNTSGTQRVAFRTEELNALVDKAQNNWYDGTAEASYVGSKDYRMKKIPRPKEFSVEDFQKR